MKAQFTMPFTESEITLNFPDENYFCFENCTAYKDISNSGIKEMDAGWFDIKTKTLYLIELKDFSKAGDFSKVDDENGKGDKKETALGRAGGLVKKAADSTAMINSILLKTNWGKALQSNLPCSFDKSYKVWLISIIHINTADQNQTANLSLLNDKFNSFFKGYRQIFNIDFAAVLSHEQAKKKFPQFIS
jgi:hypothetical protein